MAPWLLSGFLMLIWAFSLLVSCKECTDQYPDNSLSTNSLRAALSPADAKRLAADTGEAEPPTLADVVSRKLLRGGPLEPEKLDWMELYRGLGHSHEFDFTMQPQSKGMLSEVSLHDVRLDPDSMYGHAQQTNFEYLLMLDVDRLLWSFRKEAGLPNPGDPYGGWENPSQQIRGHFVGHYMSATALMWASSHNEVLHKKMSAVVDELYACQQKIGTGYLSAFPAEYFDLYERLRQVSAPYYTIHKIMAGLLDQYTLADNSRALEMVIWMAEYFGNRVKNVIIKFNIERNWEALNTETGGMNDVLYKLYTITGDPNHMILAQLFDKPCFLGMLAVQADSLSDFHANTHLAIVVGAQKRYEITAESLYKELAIYFMNIVNSSHTYATGGTSSDEHWRDPKHMVDTLNNTNSEESCTTYNMLKISQKLFKWTKERAYADYYERAMINGVLSIQRGREPGIMIYFLPQGRGASKTRSHWGWGTKYNAFWCCYGTATESFSKLGDSIYFEDKGDIPGLYIIQFIPSTFNWRTGGFILEQKAKPLTSSDTHLQVSFTISANESSANILTLNVRIPSWTDLEGVKASLNNEALYLPYPGDFLSITRKWASNDTLDLQFPISSRPEAIKDNRAEYASVKAILFGPIVLAGLTSGEWDMKAEENASCTSDWLTPIPSSYNSHLVSLYQESNSSILALTYSNKSLTMENWPESGTDDSGTDAAVHATFRLVSQDSDDSWVPSPKTSIGHRVMLEPFDLPGMLVVEKGVETGLTVTTNTSKSSVFEVVSGLDGKNDTISLESVKEKGCFVHGGMAHLNGTVVLLKCLPGEEGAKHDEFQRATSFKIVGGLRLYDPISFAAKGVRRNFLLEPIMRIKDESYTLYFNMVG